MTIRRKPSLKRGSLRSAHSGMSRADLTRANLKRFHELIQRGQGTAAPAAVKPAPPAPPPAEPQPPPVAARPPVGEVISPPKAGRGGVSGIRMAQAARQVRVSVTETRDLLREETSHLFDGQQGMDQIVAAAQRIAQMAISGVQHTGEIAEVATAAAIYEAQRPAKAPEETPAVAPETASAPPATSA